MVYNRNKFCALIFSIFTFFGGAFSQIWDKSNCPMPDQTDFDLQHVVNLPAGVTTTEMAVTPDGQVFWLELKGQVSGWNPANNQTFILANLNTYSQDDTFGPTNKLGTDDGLLGITVDKDYVQNKWIYIYYSQEGVERKYHLSRFTVANNQLTQEKVLLVVKPAYDQLCHTGGSLAMDYEGNLYLSTGDNSLPQHTSGWAPIDERPGREYVDAQETSGNTNDLRGKILRIKPIRFADTETPTVGIGTTYEIPAGNLFDETQDAQDKTLPEIYTMGHRNPYRMALHPRKLGWVAWGEVGPDAGSDNPDWGSMGMEEYNLAIKPGFFGFPYIIGHLPYNNVTYTGDRAGTTGPLFDPDNIINDSPNNTGLANLPPAITPLIWNKRNGDVFTDAGQLTNPPGTWGTMAQGGPFYKYDHLNNKSGQFPPYYDGQWFIADWTRNQIKSVYINEDGTFKEVNIFSQHTFNKIMDMEFGEDGAMYVMSWGGGPYGATGNLGRISKITYTGNQNGSCFNVPVKDRAERFNNNLLLTPLFNTISIEVPQGIARISLFNTKGELVWTKELRGSSKVDLPNHIDNGILYLGYF